MTEPSPYDIARAAARRSPLDLAVLMYPETKRWPQAVLLNKYLVALTEYRLTAQGPVPAEDVQWWYTQGGERHEVSRPQDIPSLADDLGADTSKGPVVFKLQVSMMPRAGKSRIITEAYIPWLQLRYPGIQTGLATYSDDFAKDWGKRLRDKLDEQHKLWDFIPGPKSKRESAASVNLTSGGRMRFVGRGGSITGKTLNVLVSDDLIKNSEEAESPAHRAEAIRFYDNSWLTRRTEEIGGELPIPIEVAMGTRWHVADVLAHAVKTDPEGWCVLTIPALATSDDDILGRKKGEPHPNAAGFRRRALEALREKNPQNFACLYQGDPVLEEGSTLPKRTSANVFRDLGHGQYELPDGTVIPEADCRRISANDMAATKKTRADYTVMLHALHHPPTDSLLIMRDGFYGRISTDEYEDVLDPVVKRFGPAEVIGEDITYGRVYGEHLESKGWRVEYAPHTRDKVVKVTSSQLPRRITAGTLFFPEKDPIAGDPDWLIAYDLEAPPFPDGEHDDVVDTLAHLSWWAERLPKHKVPDPEAELRKRKAGESYQEYLARRQMADIEAEVRANDQANGHRTSRASFRNRRFRGVSHRRRRRRL